MKMKDIVLIAFFGLLYIFGYNYVVQPNICNKSFCSGDVVFVPSENRTAVLEIGAYDYEYDMTNVHYSIPITSDNWPGKEFYIQTKSFKDFVLITPNPETCARRYYKRAVCS